MNESESNDKNCNNRDTFSSNDCQDFTSKFSNIDIGSRNIVSQTEENSSKIDVERLEEYHFNLTWSMDTNIYTSSQSQFEFFQKKYLDNKDLNEHEKQYLLDFIKKKFEIYNVENKKGDKYQCKYCNNWTHAANYCEFCIRNYLQQKFRKWTSGIKDIDEIIQEAQRNTMGPDLGTRPEIVEGTPPDFAKIIVQCWDYNPEKRPDAKSICKQLYTLRHNLPDNAKHQNISNEDSKQLNLVPKDSSSINKWLPSKGLQLDINNSDAIYTSSKSRNKWLPYEALSTNTNNPNLNDSSGSISKWLPKNLQLGVENESFSRYYNFENENFPKNPS
ncbi:kinase-like domain-containing protein [Gigaspora margarita]|uniref:Kinase-like domain-containing protein n=1 Tax=Gigaspora margarita TaxID=4874 RepID=A0A8H4EJV5_GIGMA|nr:kinase-like domain-containing protein [Gigaspora margarita]